jgi:two-component system sensor histidine kinase BaeS
MRSLRLRFILSHVLPLMIVIPLVGILLIYVIESRVLVPQLARELDVEANLVNSLLAEADIQQLDRPRAQSLIDEISPNLLSRMMIFDAEGHLLGSSDPADDVRIGELFTNSGLQDALNGIASQQQTTSRNLDAEIADLWHPVMGPDGQVLGVVRLSHRLATALSDFLAVRYTIGAFVLGGLLLGSVLGWVLAEGLSNPINQVVKETRRLASGFHPETIPLQGSTETRVLIESFNILVERLTSFEQSRRQLLANLVHELGRTLGAMGSAIQSLLIGADRDETLRHELLSGMKAQIRGLERLLDDLALLHELVLGKIDLKLQEVDVNLWLPQAVGSWRESALEKGIAWKYFQDDRLPSMVIDPERLDQAVGNLLSNSVKFTPKDGEIKVEAGVEGEALFISVRDTGMGIDHDDLEDIFRPLFRGFRGNRFPDGMGLGLSIARDIVEAHGGNIVVQSTKNKGSDFTIHLPLHDGISSSPHVNKKHR